MKLSYFSNKQVLKVALLCAPLWEPTAFHGFKSALSANASVAWNKNNYYNTLICVNWIYLHAAGDRLTFEKWLTFILIFCEKKVWFRGEIKFIFNFLTCWLYCNIHHTSICVNLSMCLLAIMVNVSTPRTLSLLLHDRFMHIDNHICCKMHNKSVDYIKGASFYPLLMNFSSQCWFTASKLHNIKCLYITLLLLTKNNVCRIKYIVYNPHLYISFKHIIWTGTPAY